MLIVAYEFPPVRTSGVYRPLKFARYLAEFGWNSIILTVRNPRAGQVDQSLLAELPPSVQVVRATSLEPIRVEQWLFDAIYGSSSHRREAPHSPPAHRAPGFVREPFREWFRRTVLSPLMHRVHDYLYVPDPQLGWLPAAVMRGLGLKFDAILSTSPPHSAQLVGLALAKLTGRPWIADFRDPWTDNSTSEDHPPIRRRLDRVLERQVLRHADRVINVGVGFSALSATSFPEIPSAKHLVIPNGFDEADFATLDAPALYRAADTGQLRILSIGTIYPNSGFASLVEALGKVMDEPAHRGRIRLEMVGDLDARWAAIFEGPPFKGAVRARGFLEHGQAIRAMMEADVLLLTPAGGQFAGRIVPGKVFELMRCGRPILLVGWPGETADIVRRSGLGIIAPAEAPGEIAEALRVLSFRKREGGLTAAVDWAFVHGYERRSLTERLAKALNDIVVARRELM